MERAANLSFLGIGNWLRHCPDAPVAGAVVSLAQRVLCACGLWLWVAQRGLRPQRRVSVALRPESTPFCNAWDIGEIIRISSPARND